LKIPEYFINLIETNKNELERTAYTIYHSYFTFARVSVLQIFTKSNAAKRIYAKIHTLVAGFFCIGICLYLFAGVPYKACVSGGVNVNRQ